MLGACGDDSAPVDSGTDARQDTPPAAPAPSAPSSPSPEPAAPEPIAAPVIEDGMAVIPAGTLQAGSLPGTIGRVARSEADAVPVIVPAFRIDVRPFGGESEQANVTRDQAAELCDAEGKRLCDELEWERACEGPANDRFAGGETFEAEAPSAFGVERMGSIGEWTSSPPVRELAPSASSGAVFRGAGGEQEDVLRRCNARRGTDASTQSRHLSFRCCQSEQESAAAYPDERNRARFRPLNLDRQAVRALMRRVPALAPYADTFEPTTPEIALSRLGEAGVSVLAGWELAPAIMSWSPAAGDELWVLNGVSAGRPILAAVYPLPGDQLLHATSLVLEEGAPPFIVAYTPPERGMLRWSTEWGTSAESGVLALGEDSRVTFEIR